MASDITVSNLVCALETDTGKHNSQREDYSDYFRATATISWGGEIVVAVVGDGVSARTGGDEASRIAVERIKQYFEENETSEPQKAIGNAIESAHNAIVRRQNREPALAKMTSTVTVAIFAKDRLFVGNVGNSRAYLFRKDLTKRITVDHTIVEDLVNSGGIMPEEAQRHPNRHVLTRALGSNEATEPEIYTPEFLQPDDVVLLCTDGLTDLVDEVRIKEIVLSQPPQAAARTLVQAALHFGGHDNITILVVQVPALVAQGAPMHVPRAAATTLPQIVTVLGVLAGLSVAVASIYTAIVERPTVATPAFFAALCTIVAALCIYLSFATEDAEGGLIRSPHDSNIYIPRRFKYSAQTRFITLTSGILCIILVISSVSYAIARTSITIPAIVTPIASATLSPSSTATITETPTATATVTEIPTATMTVNPSINVTSSP